MKASASWSPSCLARYWQGAESLIPWNFTIDYSPSLLSPPLFLKSVLAWLNPPGTSSPYRRNQHHQHHPTYSPRRISLLLWPQVVGVGFVDSSSLRTVQRKCPRWFASEATLPRRSGAGLLGSGACWFMLVQAFRTFQNWNLETEVSQSYSVGRWWWPVIQPCHTYQALDVVGRLPGWTLESSIRSGTADGISSPWMEIHHRDTRYGRAQVLILIWKGDKRLEKHSTWKVAATYGSLCDCRRFKLSLKDIKPTFVCWDSSAWPAGCSIAQQQCQPVLPCTGQGPNTQTQKRTQSANIEGRMSFNSLRNHLSSYRWLVPKHVQ